jgi:hypothetical protein
VTSPTTDLTIAPGRVAGYDTFLNNGPISLEYSSLPRLGPVNFVSD